MPELKKSLKETHGFAFRVFPQNHQIQRARPVSKPPEVHRGGLHAAAPGALAEAPGAPRGAEAADAGGGSSLVSVAGVVGSFHVKVGRVAIGKRIFKLQTLTDCIPLRFPNLQEVFFFLLDLRRTSLVMVLALLDRIRLSPFVFPFSVPPKGD